MTKEQAIAMLKAKRKCIELDTNGNAELCDRNCGNCKLNYEQGNMGEQKEALDMAIKSLEQQPTEEEVQKVVDYLLKPKSKPTSEDCVSRQAILDAITEIDDNINMDIYTNEVREIIRALPPVTPTQRWIPVSEELPKKNMPCLVSVGDLNLTQIAMYSDLMGTIDHKIFYQGDYGHDTFRDITKYVRAWQPLPKAYEEKRGNEND